MLKIKTTKMAETNEEKGLLGHCHKSHRGYGSTSVNMKKPEHIVRHRVSKQDTIQGIALRYGVTVSDIIFQSIFHQSGMSHE